MLFFFWSVMGLQLTRFSSSDLIWCHSTWRLFVLQLFWEVGNVTSVWCVCFDAWNDANLIITVLRAPYFSRDASGSDVLTWIDHGPLKWLIKSTNEMKSLMGNYALQNWCGCVSFIENASLIGTNLFISFKTCWSGNDTAWRVWRWSRIEVDDCLSHSALW